MTYWIHPATAHEHKPQIAYYEVAQKGLGRRYPSEYQKALARACATPQQARIIYPPDLFDVSR